MTTLRGNLNSVDLANIFQMLSMNQREGTLYIFGEEGRKAIYFGNDGVSMLARGRTRHDSLGRILLRHDWISEEQLTEALKRQDEGSDRLLGQVLVEQGVITRQQIEDALRIQIEEEIYLLFLTEGAQFEFEEGAPAEEFADTAGLNRVTFSVNSLIMEAAQRIDEWEWILSVVGSNKTIYKYSGRNAALDDPIFQEAAAGKVLSVIDGCRNVDEIVDSSYSNRFDVAKIMALLIESEALVPVPVPELRRAAEAAVAEGDTVAAVKFLSQLVEVRGDTPEMHRQLAEAYESERELERAAFHYRVFAEIQADSGNVKPAFEVYCRIVEMLPTDLAAADRKIEIFAINPNGLEEHARDVIELGKQLAEIYVELHRSSRAIQVLHRVVSLGPDDPDLRSRLIEVYLAGGMSGEAIAEYEALAETAMAVRDYAEAEHIYRKILSIDRERDDVLTRLNQLISRKTERRRSTRNAALVGVLIAAVLAAAWYGYQVFDDYRNDRKRDEAQAAKVLAELGRTNADVVRDLDKETARLVSAKSDPEKLVEIVKDLKERKPEISQRSSAAVAAFLSVVEDFVDTSSAERARDESARVERASKGLNDALASSLEVLQSTAKEYLAAGEELLIKQAPTREQYAVFHKAALVAEPCTAFRASEEGAALLGYEANLREALDQFDTAQKEIRGYVEARDAAKGFERAMRFFESYPPPDLAADMPVPVWIRTQPSDARITVNGEVLPNTNDGVVLTSIRRATTVLVDAPGFQSREYVIESISGSDPKVLRSKIQREHVIDLPKKMAFVSGSVGGRIEAAVRMVAGHVVVATRGDKIELLDPSNGAVHDALPTRNPTGVSVRPATDGTILAITARDRTVYFFDVKTRTALGRYNALGEIHGEPALIDGVLVIADADGHLAGVNMKTQREVWRYPGHGRPRLPEGFRGAVLQDGRRAIALGIRGRAHVITASNGKVERTVDIRRHDEAEQFDHAPVVVEGDIIAVSRSGRLFRTNMSTGTRRWVLPLGIDPVGPPMVKSGMLYVVGRNGAIMTIRAADGQLVDTHEIGARVGVEATLDGAMLLVGDATGRLTALDLSTTSITVAWEVRIPRGDDDKPIPISARPVVEQGLVLIGSTDNRVRAILR